MSFCHIANEAVRKLNQTCCCSELREQATKFWFYIRFSSCQIRDWQKNGIRSSQFAANWFDCIEEETRRFTKEINPRFGRLFSNDLRCLRDYTFTVRKGFKL